MRVYQGRLEPSSSNELSMQLATARHGFVVKDMTRK